MCLSDDCCMFLLVNVERTISPPSTNSSPRQTLNDWPSWSAAHEGRQSCPARNADELKFAGATFSGCTVNFSFHATRDFRFFFFLEKFRSHGARVDWYITLAPCDRHFSKKKQIRCPAYWACEKQLVSGPHPSTRRCTRLVLVFAQRTR